MRKNTTMGTSVGLRDAGIGFCSAAVLLGAAYFIARPSPQQTASHPPEEEIVYPKEKEDLERRLRIAEQHNDRLRDELVLADIRYKQLHDNRAAFEVSSEKENPSAEPVAVNLAAQVLSDIRNKKDSLQTKTEPEKAVNLDSFIEDMKEIAYANYERVKQNNKPKSANTLRAEFIRKAQEHRIPVKTWKQLQEYFEQQGKYLFLENGRSGHGFYGEVILAVLESKKDKNLAINGKDLSFVSIAIRDYIIRDYSEYESNGKLVFPSYTIRNLVVHNLNFYYSKAKEAWECLDGNLGLIDEFRRNLIKAEWENLYKKCIRKHASKQAAKNEFILQAVDDITKGGDVHEAYHLSVRGTKYDTNDLDEEIRSIYFEYAHSPLNYAAMLGEAYRLLNPPDTYRSNKTSIITFTEFIDYIQAEQRKGRFGNIKIQGNALPEQVQNLYLLKRAEIKEIAQHLFEKRHNRSAGSLFFRPDYKATAPNPNEMKVIEVETETIEPLPGEVPDKFVPFDIWAE